MVQWTVTLAGTSAPDRLARASSSYDVPRHRWWRCQCGALVAGPLADQDRGASHRKYGAAVLILVASLLALAPPRVRALRSSQTPRSEAEIPRVMAGS